MTSSPTPRRRLWPALTIGAIAMVMIGVVILTYSPDDATGTQPTGDASNLTESHEAQPSQEDPERIDVARRDANDPLAVGEVDAPVALVVYSDFQCRYCAMWTAETLPTMLEYVDEGQMRIEWRDIAIFGEDSYNAALAAYAAGEQGEHLAFSQALLGSGEAPSSSTITDEGLQTLASDLGLDVDAFNQDRTSQEVATQVQNNIAEAQALGASGTPAFLLNGIPISGAQPTENFTEIIDAELERAS